MKYTYLIALLALCCVVNGFTIIELFQITYGPCLSEHKFGCNINALGTVECRTKDNLTDCDDFFGETTCSECYQISTTNTWCNASGIVNQTENVGLCGTASTLCSRSPCFTSPFFCGLSRTYWATYNSAADYPSNVAWPISEDTLLCNLTYLEIMQLERGAVDEYLRTAQDIVYAKLNLAIGVPHNETLLNYIYTSEAILGNDCGREFNRTENRFLHSQRSALRDYTKQSLCLPGQCAGDGSYIPYGRKTGYVSSLNVTSPTTEKRIMKEPKIDLLEDDDEGSSTSSSALLMVELGLLVAFSF